MQRVPDLVEQEGVPLGRSTYPKLMLELLSQGKRLKYPKPSGQQPTNGSENEGQEDRQEEGEERQGDDNSLQGATMTTTTSAPPPPPPPCWFVDVTHKCLRAMATSARSSH